MAGEEMEIRQLSRYLDWVGRVQKPGEGGKFLLRTTGSSGAVMRPEEVSMLRERVVDWK